MADRDERIFLIQDVNPEPWESPEAAIGRKRGKLVPQLFTKPKQRMYQESLRSAFHERYGFDVELAEGEISVEFYFWRDMTPVETARSRKTRAHVADATNLQKATEDALQGLLYANDEKVKHVQSLVVEQDVAVRPAILIIIRPYKSTKNELRALAVRILKKLSLKRPEDRPPPELDHHKADLF